MVELSPAEAADIGLITVAADDVGATVAELAAAIAQRLADREGSSGREASAGGNASAGREAPAVRESSSGR